MNPHVTKTLEQFTIQHNALNTRHARFTVFANGAHCGQLTMTVPEWIAFCTALKIAASVADSPIALTFDGEPLDNDAPHVPMNDDGTVNYTAEAEEGKHRRQLVISLREMRWGWQSLDKLERIAAILKE